MNTFGEGIAGGGDASPADLVPHDGTYFLAVRFAEVDIYAHSRRPAWTEYIKDCNGMGAARRAVETIRAARTNFQGSEQQLL